MGTRTTLTDEGSSALHVIHVERVSVASDGTEANGGSASGSISPDGRFVTYSSAASNLVLGDTNNFEDVFVHDRQTRATERVSVASDGTEGSGASYGPSISADGRYVAFESVAFELAPNMFVHDRQTNATDWVSVPIGPRGEVSEGFHGSISADGRSVLYSANDRGGNSDILVFDRQTDTRDFVPVASGDNPFTVSQSISADGRFVTYSTLHGYSDTTEGIYGVFVVDRQTDTTELVSVASDGTDANGLSDGGSISADGRFVAYQSDATNLVPGDTNGATDVFVFDRQTSTTERVSVASDGSEASGAGPSISPDGRFVAYSSAASNLVPGDTNGTADVFVFDRQTHTTTRVSVASDGAEANGRSSSASISSDGRTVTYWSDASNLVPGDTNGVSDVFVVQIDVASLVDGVVKDGDDGDNHLKGTHRDDILRGHGGNDRLFGHKGNDWLDGGDGNDKIFAGKGDDTILAGAGNDWIWTGKGADLVVFNEGDGHDRVFNFDQHRHANEHSFDRVQLDVSIGSNHIDNFAELEALIASGDIGLSTRKGSLTLTFDNGDALTLGGVHALSAEGWLFS